MRTRLLLAGLLLAGLPLAAQQPEPPPAYTIQVAATGRFQAAPDTAVIEFEILAQDKDPRKAYAQAQAQAESLRALLGGQGIAAQRAEIGSFDQQPNLDPRTRRVVDYTVTGTVRLELADFSRIGPLVDAAGASGNATFRSLTFLLKNMQPARDAALQDAWAQCRHQADVIAAAAGTAIVGLADASIDVNDSIVAPRPMAAARVGMAAPAPPPTEDFTPHPVEITARVTARYRFKP